MALRLRVVWMRALLLAFALVRGAASLRAAVTRITEPPVVGCTYVGRDGSAYITDDDVGGGRC